MHERRRRTHFGMWARGHNGGDGAAFLGFRVAVTLNLVTQSGGRRSAVIISVPCALPCSGSLARTF